MGLAAEVDMYAATGGVNTHKGALFSLGLLCAACGRLQAQTLPLTVRSLCDLAAQMTAGITQREMQATDTNGLKVHAVYGAKGVRGEAESGFASVRELALPHLRQENGAYLALLHLIAHVRDTNVLHRAGEEGLRWLQGCAQCLLEQFSIPALEQLDRECIEKNISPGGCADLLAIALFLERVT
jgi:triphosphoribosyl-dephospho-CoA synthase